MPQQNFHKMGCPENSNGTQTYSLHPYILSPSLFFSLCPNFHKDKGLEAGAAPPANLQPVWTSEFLAKLPKQTKQVSKHWSGEGSHKKGGERKGSSAFLSSVEPPSPTSEHHLSQ